MDQQERLANLNEDWIKVGHWDLPTEMAGFTAVIGVDDTMTYEQRRAALEHFCELPASIAMPAHLRAELQIQYGLTPAANADEYVAAGAPEPDKEDPGFPAGF